MALRVEHELHHRRAGRNKGVAIVLVSFIAVVFGLTLAKVSTTGPVQGFDHVVRPELVERGQ